MRIVFMGTPDFAVPSLARLLADGQEIVGVFTQPDKPKGRGYQLAPPPVKELALKHGLEVFQPAKMRDGEALAILKQLAPDLIIVVAYGKILPKEILELPQYGCINVHGSLLPKYRGAAPIQWSVLNGDAVAGVTTMYMAQGLDTGDMILSKQTPIGADETSGELFERLSQLGAQLLAETVALVAQGSAPRVAQQEQDASYAPMLAKEQAAVDWNRSAVQVHNLVRGMNPWPVAYTMLDGKRLRIYRVKPVEANGEAGVVLEGGKRLVVACGTAAVEILELQADGSKRMQAVDYLRGHPVAAGIKLG
ncbi:MAG: methionyl-tRNA formyltransferase [Anaerotruncus sp.]|nr:methionyl-tRNA formyltransferase [Anaerotruncus sp.]